MTTQTIRFLTDQRNWNADGSCRIERPFPAKASLPAWFKNLNRYCPSSKDEFPDRTVKMCPPFLEAMVHGYVIPAPFPIELDFDATCGNDGKILEVLPEEFTADENRDWKTVVDFRTGPPLKPMVLSCRSFWRIQTPPGYSCLLMEPINRNVEELPFRVLPRIIETDQETKEIFISLVPRVDFPIAIKHNTPLIQVIPFERTEWELKKGGFDADLSKELDEFNTAYWDCENRQFDEGADPTNPKQGYGAFNKLVKDPNHFR